jgi:hypothetical protein
MAKKKSDMLLVTGCALLLSLVTFNRNVICDKNGRTGKSAQFPHLLQPVSLNHQPYYNPVNYYTVPFMKPVAEHYRQQYHFNPPPANTKFNRQKTEAYYRFPSRADVESPPSINVVSSNASDGYSKIKDIEIGKSNKE